MPKVSIIVPVYNVEDYVDRCLQSLCQQTLEDIEIIVVNDGSTDNSKLIISKYEKKYPQKIKYFEKINGGLSDARNYGLKYATGDYIAFLDSDDYVEQNTYEKMYNEAVKTGSDMVECDFYWLYPNKKKLDCGRIYHGKKEMMRDARVVAWNKLYKSKIIEESKIEFPKGLRYEDIEFFYKMIPYINSVSFVKDPLIYYTQRESSISKVQNERTSEIFDVFENVFKYYKENNIFDEYKDYLEYTYTRILLCSSLRRMVKIKEKKVRKELLDMTWEKINKEFPNWKKNSILQKEKGIKNVYIRTMNKFAYKFYCFIFRFL